MKQQQWRGEAVDNHLPDPLDLEERATVDIARMPVPSSQTLLS